MSVKSHTVLVEQLPEISNRKQARAFLREITGVMSVDSPRIVLDCSRLSQVEPCLIHGLLCCLEEAIKRNGDVKLAAVPPMARSILKVTGADRVFEIFDTNGDAVRSFSDGPSASPSQPISVRSHNARSAA